MKNTRKKALDSMLKVPTMSIVISSRDKGEGPKDDEGMVMMKVSQEEKEMILNARAEKSEGDEAEEEEESDKSFNPFKKASKLV